MSLLFLKRAFDLYDILKRVKKGLLLTSLLFSILFLFLLGIFLLFQTQMPATKASPGTSSIKVSLKPTPTFAPLAIETLRNKSYPGSLLKVEEQLTDGINYHQAIVSYQSDGLKIYALLTVPTEEKPPGGFPAILFNHGYIAPTEYQTAPVRGQYASYVAALASQGFIVLKPDYRGNGKSEGNPVQAYVSPGYIIDDLNALSSLEKYPSVNAQRVGVWGHSMGGFITLDDLVVTKNIKAAVIWSGVVGSSDQLLAWWKSRHISAPNDIQTRSTLQTMFQTLGTPQTNPTYWQRIDPTRFLSSITSPIQLHVGLADTTVPPDFTISLADRLQKAEKSVELFQYPGDDHNISNNFSQAMNSTVTFFKAKL